MLVRTEGIRENDKSIGMFSRHGKMTTVIHSIFRNKVERTKPKKSIEADLFSRLLAQDNSTLKEKFHKIDNKPSESFYFRAISREKAQPVRSKTPDVGRYRPRHNLVEPKVIYYSSAKEKIEKPVDMNKYLPDCVKNGAVCEFKARKLKKQVDDLRHDLNKSNVDVESLYRNHVISRDVYKLFKTPSLKLLKVDKSELEDERDTNNVSTIQDGFDGAFQNNHEIINQIINYENVKQELKKVTKQNQKDLDELNKIPEKPRSSTSTPTPLRLQTRRASVGKPRYNYQELGVDISILDQENNSSSFCNDRLRKTCTFDNYSKRKPAFPPKDIVQYFYDYDKWKLTKAEKVKQVVEFDKMISRPQSQGYKGTCADFSDLLNSYKKVRRKANHSFEMNKVTSRKFSIPKETSPLGKLGGAERTPSIIFSSANHGNSYMSKHLNASFL